MKSNLKVVAPVIGAAILAAALATPTSAARHHDHPTAVNRPSVAVQAPPPVRPIAGRDFIGTDPDPQIRFQLRRDPGNDRL